MFPGAHAQVYYNEAGEVLGWDYPSDEPQGSDPYDDYVHDRHSYGYPDDGSEYEDEEVEVEEVRDDFLCTNCDGSGCLDCRPTFYDTEEA